MRKSFLLTTMLVLYIATVIGQAKLITGKITDATGDPVLGVTIQFKGQAKGTVSDPNGAFKLEAEKGQVLVISGLGYETKEVTVNGNTLNIVLAKSDRTINEVVVTALGIKREKKALGYAVQEVKGTELTQTNETNILNSLSGRAAGVQINNNGGAVGSSTSIVLRGFNSFGNNAPLIVVDGIPINNGQTNVTPGTLRTTSQDQPSAVDYGNGIQDIDPDNIASVSILKGANAAALYGYRAGNGVILITTKSGKSAYKGVGISYTGGLSFEKQYILPNYQNKYGQGSTSSEYWYNLYKAADPANTLSYQDWALQNGFAYVDGQGSGVNDGVDESWGPRMDIGLKLPQYNSPLDANGNRTATPWVSHPDNVKDFFKTGFTLNNNVALTSNSNKGSTRLALGHQRQMGTIPNTDQTRYTAMLNTSQNLTEKLRVEAMANYIQTLNDNLVGQGYNEFNPLQSLGSWFGRQVDIHDLKNNWDKFMPNPAYPATGVPYNWNLNYHDNPYLSMYKNTNSRTKNRLLGYASVSYDFGKWFNLMGRIGTDWYSEGRTQTTSHLATANFIPGNGGQFTDWSIYANETNADLIATGGGKLGKDFSLTYTAGGNYRDYKTKNTSVTANDLTVPDLFTIGNAKGTPTNTMRITQLRSNSVFAQASFGFRNWLYLDLTGRNDWNSTLPASNRSYFYPSASLSWIFSDALKLSNSAAFTYGKLRVSYAEVGNGAGVYQLIRTFAPQPGTFGGVTEYHEGYTLAPQNLKPERAKSIEAGAELHFLDNRVNVDATWYNKKTINQIMPVNISAASGADFNLINAGEIQNKGVELQLNLGILRSDNGFNWDMTINWSKNKSQVNSLYTDPRTGQAQQWFQFASAWTVTVGAIPGQAFGVIRGADYVTDPKSGAIVVGANGLPSFKKDQVLGNITPDWIGGINNSFRYRNFNLSFLIDMRKGGDIFSVTQMFGANTGVLDYTAAGNIRETGVVLGKDILTDRKFVDASGNPNTKVVAADRAFKYLSYDGASSGTKFDIIDGTFIKLRTIQFGYNIPANLISRWGWLKSAGVSVFAQNVALLHVDKSNTAHIDPETGFGTDLTSLGVEEYQIPSNRSIGLKLNLNF
ncbi:SusC/RagA family TonB-linked outer membrane protein [Chitinophaga polysaccharea]|uniref:SusC/RagA family TonB-linked outer membrane protein n=1 Tax=Chitinophaga polysaccharea TaxID=1293035 RepID=UPI001455D8A2|nr:SusC/RagA family TonB-linked outer membrane protein [Chitinophaga polysaccharea]NLR60825.1 SusC/RagA family TonB-linked outer membrane protein [Chitinophaga polysaccharea]